MYVDCTVSLKLLCYFFLNFISGTFSGDDVSAHMIGGFRMCFQSGRICCYCMATHSEIKLKFQEDGFVLRTAEVHDYHLQCVRQNKENSALYVVRCTSPFNTLRC